MSQPCVLIIDDEELIRLALTDILEAEGWSVITAPDGESGLELFRAREDQIDVVLLDLNLPGLSGEETLAGLRVICPQARIIVASGHDPHEVARRFTVTGSADYIRKPFDDVQLLATLRRHVPAR